MKKLPWDDPNHDIAGDVRQFLAAASSYRTVTGFLIHNELLKRYPELRKFAVRVDGSDQKS